MSENQDVLQNLLESNRKWAADKVAKDKGGAQEMQADWKRSAEQMRRAAIEDEEVLPA